MERPRIRKQVSLFIPLILAATSIAACSPGSQTEQSALSTPEQTLPTDANPTLERVQPQDSSKTQPEAEQPVEAVETQSGSGYQLGFEPGDSNLKASNPKQESLAAGKPQLIEFFAFW